MSYNTGLGIRQKWTLTGASANYAYTGNTATLTLTPFPFWNQQTGFGTQGGTLTSITATWSNALAGPSVIVLTIYQFVTGGASLTGVSDSVGNSYTQILASNVGTLHGYMYVASNASTASGATITVTVSPAAHILMEAIEMLNISTTATATASNPQSTAGNTPGTGTLSSIPADGVAIISYGCAANPNILPMPTTPDGTTTIQAGGTLPQSTITVGSTTSIDAAGWALNTAFNITHSATISTVTAGGSTLTTFTGCTGGSGTISVGDAVASAVPIVAQTVTPTFDIGFSVGNYPSPTTKTNQAFNWHGTVTAGSLGLAASFAVTAPTVH